MIKTGLAVSLAASIAGSLGVGGAVVGASVSAAAMIAPNKEKEREWAKNRVLGILIGAVAGLLLGQLFADALWLTGLMAIVLIKIYSRLGFEGAILGGLTNFMIMLDRADDGLVYAAYRLGFAIFGIALGLTINRLVLPYSEETENRSE